MKKKLKPKARRALEKKKKGITPSIPERMSLSSFYKKEMRQEPTPTEVKVMQVLAFSGIKCIFQKVFLTKYSFYIVDFYLPEYKLVIEVDGKHHYTNKSQFRYDGKRTNYLQSIRGCKVIRFTNKEVRKDIGVVIDRIKSVLETLSRERSLSTQR